MTFPQKVELCANQARLVDKVLPHQLYQVLENIKRTMQDQQQQESVRLDTIA